MSSIPSTKKLCFPFNMPNFDITKFLSELPRVPLTKITQYKDAKCPIYQVVYLKEDPDTGYAEHLIRMPGCNQYVFSGSNLPLLS